MATDNKNGDSLDLFSLTLPDNVKRGEPEVLSDDFVSDLNDVQREAVMNTDGPTLIVAGAGSGKTRVLTCRIAWILSNGVEPWRLLALTFTNKAAREMKERIGAIVGERRAAPLWMGTFHSVFSRILRREAEALGYTSSFTIYDTDDSLSVIRQIMAGRGISPQDYAPKAIRNRISAAKNSMVNPGLYRAQVGNALEERVARVYEDYELKLKGSNALDFDDLLVKTIELFELRPEILEAWQDQFRYVLIDEYQDTNRAQYTVVKMLAGKHQNICVVGDDAQSIYRFRGADIRNILDFERDYPNYQIYRLEQNYRSTKTILAAADDVIGRNRGQIKKSLWTDNDQGEQISVLTLRDERDEGSEVVRMIRDEQQREVSLNEIAVLYRINSQSLSIEDALRRANIPYTLVGGVAFYQRAEVKDALAYLRLLVNERDDESFLRGVNRPARGIGEVSIRRLRAAAESRGWPLLQMAHHADEIKDLTPRATNGLRNFAGMIDTWRTRLTDAPLPEIARMALTESGLIGSFKDEGTPEAMARWDNVQRLLSHIAEYVETNPDGTLDQYLQEISLISDLDNYEQVDERVTLMTIHSAKGLEFETVIVPGMEEGLFPIGQSASDQEELEEERRLFYVAVTRAKKRLYLTNCERRYRFGELSYPTPSRFLNEIGDEHLRFNSTAPRPRSASSFSSTSIQSRRRPIVQKSKEETFDEWTPDPLPDDDYSQIPKTLQVGSIVAHDSFGKGRVDAIVGEGEKTRVTVRFEGVGRKQLMLKFAKLRVL
ncbi:MAG: UvrD-helicase domain-containing protein [Ignavibacteriae bacterium]|nr:UvrD-helicase domain-containing protein [Ignavibacteriota bacterium]MCB9215233.1 UvrD-helicase domain-containing protein [Ignavibacteria bacterium]